MTKQNTTKLCAYFSTCNVAWMAFRTFRFQKAPKIMHKKAHKIGTIWRRHQMQFFLHKLVLIPAWISNQIHYKEWDKITYPIPKLQRCNTSCLSKRGLRPSDYPCCSSVQAYIWHSMTTAHWIGSRHDHGQYREAITTGFGWATSRYMAKLAPGPLYMHMAKLAMKDLACFSPLLDSSWNM